MSGNSEETIPQIALFIQESSVRPPPPPPQAASNSAPRTAARVPRPMIVPTQHLPPPPPPPPPAVPSTSTSQLHNIVYRGESVNQPSTSFAMCHPPTTIPMFDARRPPPPIPTHAQPNNNILKRPMSNSFTANKPSKLRKTMEPKHDDALCDVCVQREISIENYRMKMEKISSEDECQTLLLKKKENEYLRQKDFLRSLVDCEMFRKIEQFVEDVPQYNFHSVLNNLKYSCRTGVTPSTPKQQMLLQIMDYFLSDSSKFESSQSERVEGSLRQTISAMSRSPVRRSSPDFLQKLQDMLYNEDRTSSSERHGYGEQSEEHAHSSGTNGMSSHRGYSNGQLPPPAPLPPSAPLPPPMSALPPLAPFAPVAPPPTATYSHYPPPRPYYPPPRPYYPPPYLPPSAPRATTTRAPVPPRPPNAEERYPSPYYYYHQ